MAKADFSSYELHYTFNKGADDEFKLIVRKGPSGYGKHYVLDGVTRKYLTKGAQSKSYAISQMLGIAGQMGARS
ncbi:hypothetical protein MYRNA_39 [Mycobacterium phage Myrna]|uniref:Uncharacterized protein n=1 Tax=Mycobacterium phage Myrna TaxID=546805 RepID=B5LJ50_9CAUD|nr:gp39 [Mycobacterium phage Myrna]ACH62047.1 hypothetical protein MYRNA_39 [Mycobacterium phage Myrna]